MMAKRMRRVLSLILAMVMCLSLVNISALATGGGSGSGGVGAESQIGPYYQADQDTGSKTDTGLSEDGTSVTAADGKVTVDKTIAETDKENEFDITLQVTTTEDLEQLEISPDAAVVIVMDTSVSMQWDLNGGGYATGTEYDGKKCDSTYEGRDGKDHTIPMEEHDSSVYIQDADGGAPDENWAGAHANGEDVYASGNLPKENWLQNSRIEKATQAVDAFIDGYVQNAGTAKRYLSVVNFSGEATQTMDWTNLTASGADNAKSTINGLCRSGVENPVLDSGTNIHDALLKAEDLIDSTPDNIENRYVILLTDGDPNRHMEGDQSVKKGDHKTPAAQIAAQILQNTTLYAIAYSSDVSSVRWLGEEATGEERNNFVAYDSSETGNLNTIFESIVTQITNYARAWTVTDPMGEDMKFVGFLDGSDLVPVHSAKQAGESGGVITWDLKHDITVEEGYSGSSTTYTYTLSYRVRLNNLNASSEDQEYPTNGVTYLKYYTDESQLKDPDGMPTVYFNYPTVKSELGTLTFTKVDAHTDKGLKGAQFELAHTGCSCGMSGSPDLKATSDENGTVTFDAIPSGHTYTLRETSQPDGYVKSEKTYTVTVADGVVTVTDNGAAWDNKFANMTEVQMAPLTVTKTFTAPSEDILTSVMAADAFHIDVTASSEQDPMVTLDTNSVAGGYVTGVDVSSATETDGIWAKTVTWTLSLPEGDYTVAEDYTGAQTNYVVTVTGNATQTVNLDAEQDPAASVSFANAYADKDDTLGITKTDGKETVVVGETVEYIITVTNQGNITVNDVEVVDTLPAGLTVDQSSISGGTYKEATVDDEGNITAPATITWTIASLAAGATETFKVKATVNDAAITSGTTGTIKNTAAVYLDDTKEAEADDTDTVTKAAVTIEKTASATSVYVGDTFTYEITVTNGGSAEAKNVTVTDALPDQVSYQSNTATQGTFDSATGVWVIGNLPAGGSATLTITVKAEAAGNAVKNTAIVLVDGEEEDRDDVDVEIKDAVGTLTITKKFGSQSELIAEDVKDSITFTVTGPAGFTTQTIKYSDFVNGSYTVKVNDSTQLPFGTYYVTEQAQAETGYTLTTEVEVNGKTASAVAQGYAVTLDSSDTSGNVTFTNTYVSKTYEVIFTIVGENRTHGTLSGTMEGFDGYTEYKWEQYDSNGNGAIDEEDAYQWSRQSQTGPSGNQNSENLRTVKYTFTYGQYLAFKENGMTITKPTVTVTPEKDYSCDGLFANGAETDFVSLIAAMDKMIAGNVTTITYETEITHNTGDLEIEKTVTGLTEDPAAEHTYTFTVEGPAVNGVAYTTDAEGVTVTFDNGKAAVSIKVTGNNSNSITINDLPTGEYTVTESYTAIDGHRLTNYNANGMTVEVKDEQSVTAAVTNQYVKADGAGSFTLSFDKALIGDEGETYAVANGQFEFQVQEKITEYDPDNTVRVDKWTDVADGTTAAGGAVTITVPFEDDVDAHENENGFTSYHTYRVTEEAGSMPGMAYDDAVYELTVTVEWTWNSTDSKWTYEVTDVTAIDVTDETNPEPVRAAAADGTVTLAAADGTDAFVNVWTQVDVTVRKEFTGVSVLPADFAIEIRNGNTLVDTLTLNEATPGNGYYEWKIELPALAEGTYTFTETGYAVSGLNHSLTVQLAKRDLPNGSWSYGSRTTVTGVSFNMELNAAEYLDGVELAKEAQVRLTNAYTGGGTIIIPPDTPNPDPDPTPNPEPPVEEIPDEDVPQTDLPEEEPDEDIPEDDVPMTDLPEDPAEDIPEDDVPMADAPETGDNLAVWVAAAGVSGLGLVWIALTGRKRKEDDER